MSDNWNVNGDEELPGGAGAENAGIDSALLTERRNPLGSATLLLFGVFILGMGMIYLLGLQNKPRKATAAEAAHDDKVASAIESMLGPSGRHEQMKTLFRDTDKLVQLFYNFPGGTGVPVNELPGNPFEIDATRSAQAAVPDMIVPSDIYKASEQRKASEAFRTLKLQSVMVSKNMEAAMINNRIVTVGAKVATFFTVIEIEANRVVLSYDNVKLELKLQNNSPENGQGEKP